MDPSLVRGKKQKKESIDEEIDSKEFVTEQLVDDKSNLPMLPKLTKIDSIREQEKLLKYRADILKYQGMYLHYQASVLEQEARNRINEERKPFAFVPTIKYSGYANDYPVQDMTRQVFTPESDHEMDNTAAMDLSDHAEETHEEYFEEQEEDNDEPLDLSVKSNQNSYRHTQSSCMPRIFFSRISATS